MSHVHGRYTRITSGWLTAVYQHLSRLTGPLALLLFIQAKPLAHLLEANVKSIYNKYVTNQNAQVSDLSTNGGQLYIILTALQLGSMNDQQDGCCHVITNNLAYLQTDVPSTFKELYETIASTITLSSTIPSSNYRHQYKSMS